MTTDPMPPAPQEISLVEAVWRFRLMSVIIVLSCVLSAVAVTQILFGAVQATASFAVTDPTNTNVLRMGIVSGPSYETYTAQRAAFAESASVLNRASQIVASKGGPKLTLEQMRARVTTATKPAGGVVLVTASGDNMSMAAVTANAVVQSYQEVTLATTNEKLETQLKSVQAAAQRLSDRLALLPSTSRSYRTMQANLAKLQSQETTLLLAQAGVNDGVQFTDNADPNASAPSKLPRNAGIGLILGLIIACIASFLRASSPKARQAAAPAVGPPPVPAVPVVAAAAAAPSPVQPTPKPAPRRKPEGRRRAAPRRKPGSAPEAGRKSGPLGESEPEAPEAAGAGPRPATPRIDDTREDLTWSLPSSGRDRRTAGTPDDEDRDSGVTKRTRNGTFSGGDEPNADGEGGGSGDGTSDRNGRSLLVRYDLDR